MGILSFITIPTATELLASTTEYSTEMFSGLLPWAYLVVGMIVGALFLRAMIGVITGAVSRIAGGRRRGRGRRYGR